MMESKTLIASAPLWLDSERMPRFLRLSENLCVDVCIVGGGIAGLTTAYLLAKEGKSVCLVEDSELASGQSGRTTAHFTYALDDRYFLLEKLHGEKGIQLAAQSHIAAIEKVEGIIKEEEIACDATRVDGFLFSTGDLRPYILQTEYDATQRAGLYDVDFISRSEFPFFYYEPCLRFPNQLQLHPIKYLHGLASRFTELGGKIFTKSHVVRVEGGAPAIVTTRDGYKVRCLSAVVATNTPVNDLFTIHTKQAAYRTYVVAFTIRRGLVPQALYWDTLDPYHYIRLQHYSDDLDLLIVGGEDHKTGQERHPERCFEALESWTRNRFVEVKEPLYRWSGQVMEPVDGLAFLGHNPSDKNNIYVITADSGNGMTHGTLGAMIVTDQILKRDNPWEKLYDPSRITLKATSSYLRENANVAAQYADWFAIKRKPNMDTLALGEGTVFREGLKMIACYKNHSGDLEFLSAACTHLGGIVQWNSVEKSWDCPCHGSRFSGSGKVIEGPAFKNLSKIDYQPEEPTGHVIRSEPFNYDLPKFPQFPPGAT